MFAIFSNISHIKYILERRKRAMMITSKNKHGFGSCIHSGFLPDPLPPRRWRNNFLTVTCFSCPLKPPPRLLFNTSKSYPPTPFLQLRGQVRISLLGGLFLYALKTTLFFSVVHPQDLSWTVRIYIYIYVGHLGSIRLCW